MSLIKSQNKKNLFMLLLLLTFSILTTPLFAQAPPGLFVLDVNFVNLNFDTPILTAGADRQVGATYLYANIATINQNQIDAQFKITQINQAQIGILDDVTNRSRIEPTIQSLNANAYVEFQINFYVGNNPVRIKNFYVTGVDIDGDGSGSREFHAITNYESIVRDQSTGLSLVEERPFTKIVGIFNTLNGITFENTAAYIASYAIPTHEFRFRLGFTGSSGGSQRLHSIAIGRAENQFSNPNPQDNPCISDEDEDDLCYAQDNCPEVANPDQLDLDLDGVGDVCDNCLDIPNPDQTNLDEDLYGDACDELICAPSGLGEICDGIDNDCDGFVDTNDLGEPLNASSDPCVTGLPGICAQGLLICINAENKCMPYVDPQIEVCDGLDNDCNGRIDEAQTNTCGRCGDLPVERCDGLDNNCDGQTDEGDLCAAGQACHQGNCYDWCQGGECSQGISCQLDINLCLPFCAQITCPLNQYCDEITLSCQLDCQDDNCGEDKVCVIDHKTQVQQCVKQGCLIDGCAVGEICRDGIECVPDLCGQVSCDSQFFCRDGQCVASCGQVSCPLDQTCRDGMCAFDPCARIKCDAGNRCENGECIPDLCAGVLCLTAQICIDGECRFNPCLHIECPFGQTCVYDPNKQIQCIAQDNPNQDQDDMFLDQSSIINMQTNIDQIDNQIGLSMSNANQENNLKIKSTGCDQMHIPNDFLPTTLVRLILCLWAFSCVLLFLKRFYVRHKS